MKKIVITGGAGFIGSHLAHHLSGSYRVTVLDDLSTGDRSNLDGIDCEFIEGSILDTPLVDSVLQDTRYVFHLAAMVSVAESMTKARDCVTQNVTGLLNVLDAAVKHGVGKVVLASSAAVYGNSPQSPKRESDLPAPESPYAITKL
ncbi:NAD-dependent epimerase/dehydratase family protein, partial [Akkermansiaceae bacterium]|nr:NAD-dependent epimerase/dehydratase family protein [Akkermansiaceae bacterium]